MEKIPILKPREVVKILEKMGFLFVRSRGSHRIYAKENKKVVIPYHSKDMKKATLKSIILQSGLEINDFR